MHTLAVLCAIGLLLGTVHARPPGTGKNTTTINRYPIILVPGDGGSQFKAKLNKTTVVHNYCDKVSDWFDIWLSLKRIAPFALDCTVDNMRLVYDNRTRTTSNSPGVEILVPGFGDTETIEWLDTAHIPRTSYYADIADALVSKYNYTRGVDLRGVPFDFRKAPNEMQLLFANMTMLTEQTYAVNNNTPVILIAHSMGNNILLYWLSSQSQKWKDQHIRSYISLSAPWGGAVKALRLMASGDNIDIPFVNPLYARAYQRSAPSSAWLLPSDRVWGPNEVLIQGPRRNYTVNDYKQFFTDIDYTTGYDMRVDTFKYNYDLDSPKVELHCLYGFGERTTPAGFIFNMTSENWYDWSPEVVWGPGDGTVNMKSFAVCKQWNGANGGKPVYQKEFPLVDHLGILRSTDAIGYILTAVNPTAERHQF